MADSWTHYPIVPAQSVALTGAAQNQLFNVNGALYYVVPKQFTGALFQISVQKSTDGGKTWIETASGYPPSPPFVPIPVDSGFPVALSGSKLYIFTKGYGVPLGTTYGGIIYDTASDTFELAGLAYTADIDLTEPITCSVFPNGKILLCFLNTPDDLVCLIYDPFSDTWSLPQIIEPFHGPPGPTAGPFSPQVQCVDPAIDTAFVFWLDVDLVKCVPITSAGVIGVTVTVYTLPVANADCTLGLPCVCNGNLILPFLDPYGYLGNVPNLYVARSPSSSALAFGPPELVATALTLPQLSWVPLIVAVCLAGTLYLVYENSNSVTPSSTLQASVMYQSSTVPGTWTAAQTAWTAPLSSVGLNLYALQLGATLGIMHPFASPIPGVTLYNSFSVLSRTNPSSGGGGAGAMSGGFGGIGGGFGGSGTGGPAGGGVIGGHASWRRRCCDSGHTFQAARKAEVLRRALLNKNAWPYIHEYPPPDSIPVEQIAQIPAPPLNVLTPVLTYLVPEGFRFFLARLLEDFQGAAFDPFDALWTVDKDAVIPNVQGQPIQGLIQTPVPLGSFLRGVKWPLPRAYEFAPLTILRSTVVNQNLAGGAFVSGFFGYLVPGCHINHTRM